MTDTQFYLAIGIPVTAIVASLIVSLLHARGLRDDMRQMRAEFHSSRRSDFAAPTGKSNSG
jgi:hypothetical protein